MRTPSDDENAPPTLIEVESLSAPSSDEPSPENLDDALRRVSVWLERTATVLKTSVGAASHRSRAELSSAYHAVGVALTAWHSDEALAARSLRAARLHAAEAFGFALRGQPPTGEPSGEQPPDDPPPTRRRS